MTACVMGMGVEGSRGQAVPCRNQQDSYLYWVTAGLAFAEQWNVTTLSSSTGCGSTDRLTSGGSAERRDSFANWGAVPMVLGQGDPRVTGKVKARDSTRRGPESSHHPGRLPKVGGLSRGLPYSLGVPVSAALVGGQGSPCGFKA